MKFVIKYPTRGRPTLFVRMLNLYTSMLSRRNPVRFVVSIDEDDHSMKSEQIKGFLKRRRDVEVHVGHSRNKVEAINADFDKLGDYDILILASDDMVPVVRRYDTLIEQLFLRHFPELDGCINAWDGANHKRLMTQVIAGRRFIEQRGHIYHPAFKAVFCDDWLHHTAQRDGKMFTTDQVIFQHQWLKHTGKDATYQRNEGTWNEDKATFERLKAGLK